MWFFIALGAAAFYAVAEELDNFLVNREFRHPFVLVFFSSLFNLVFIAGTIVVRHPAFPPPSTWPLFLLLGLVDILYLYPYYRGLQRDDTSVAISFLALERIFVPILAFLLVGESLATVQYLGIVVIVFSVILLGFHRARGSARVSSAVGYIGVASFILAFEGIVLKLLFERGVAVSVAVTGEYSLSFVFGMALLLVPAIRKEIKKAAPIFLRWSPLFLAEEAFTFFGLATESYAISQASVSIVKGVTAASPFFLLAYALLGEQFFPRAFRENIRKRRVIQKLLLFALVIAGILLVKE